MSPLPITNITNLFNSWIPTFAFLATALITITLIYRIIKRNEWGGYDLMLEKVAEILIFIAISMLILAYYIATSAITTIISLNTAFTLTLIALIIETKRDKSPLLKEIQNMNISNLKKFIIGIFVDVIPFILTSIMVISFTYLEMFPGNIGFINIILEATQVNVFIMVLDVVGSLAAAAVNGKINRKANMQLNEII